MAEFPADRAAVGEEIKKLVNEKGLDKITSKIIREHLGEVFGKSFNDHKKEVDDITRTKIQEIQKEKNGSNGAKKDSESEASSSDESEGPSRKRGKPPASDSDASVDSEDEKPKKKRGKKGSDDDSDYDLASKVKKRRSGTKKEAKPRTKKTKETKPRNTGYMKQCVLSDELFHVVGKRFMRRSDVVKEMWAYIKKHDLYDRKNKQFIVPDEVMKPIFKCTKFRGFGMMKFLKNHIRDPAHLDEATLKQYRQEAGAEEPSNEDVKDESGSEEKEESDEAKPTANKADDESESGSDSDSD